MHENGSGMCSRAKVLDLLNGLNDAELRLLTEEAAQRLNERPPAWPGKSNVDISRLCHSRLFAASEEVRYLGVHQLEQLTTVVRDWYESSKSERTRRSRAKFWLVYLLLRYSGAKLHEVLSLDPTLRLDLKRALLRFEDREVQLPRSVADQVREVLDSLGGEHARSEAFRLDQGFVRRKLYEMARTAGVPKNLVSPQAIRNSRAIELLRLGMPLPVVQAVLGHSNLQLTSCYFTFAPEDVHRITEHIIRRAEGRLTSARNRFWGRVTHVTHGTVISEVRLVAGDVHLASHITNGSLQALGIRKGISLGATVKATHVMLSCRENRPIERVNAVKAVITRVIADPVLAEVDGALADGTPVCAVVAAQALEDLRLAQGDEAWFFFSSLALVLSE